MTTEQLRAVHKAVPFRPFRLHLADGTSLGVDHPELLWSTPGGRTVVVSGGGEDMSIIDLLLVTKITFGNGQSKRRR